MNSLEDIDILLLPAPVGDEYEFAPTLGANMQASVKVVVVSMAGQKTSVPVLQPLQDHLWWLDASADPDGRIGDLIGFLAADVVDGSPGPVWNELREASLEASSPKVAVLAPSGAAVLPTTLLIAAGYAGFPVFIFENGKVTEVPAIRPTPWLLIDAAARAVDPNVKMFGPRDGVVDLSMAGLLRKGRTGEDAPTLLLHHLWSLDEFAVQQNTASACVQLLRDYGYSDLAEQLQALVSFWVRTDPWSLNYVPEMVGHGQAHAVAVDRNVAQLCRPLLNEAGRKDKPLDGDDLLELAAAAWLHDWGHASAPDKSGYPLKVTAVETRAWHGEFTKIRLNDPSTKELAFPSILSAGINVGRIAALAAHHQGWTSLGDSVAELDNIQKKPFPGKDPKRQAHRYACDLSSGEVSNKDHECDPAPKEHECDPALHSNEKDRIKLACLRIADAADAGLHRVPDSETQPAAAKWIAQSFARDAAVGLRKKASDHLASAVSSSMIEAENLRKNVRQVFTIRKDGLLEKAKKAQEWAVFVEVMNYSEHVANQWRYFQEQLAVRLAIPVPELRGAEKPGLRFAVVPHGQAQGARECVQNLVLRELGFPVERAGAEGHVAEPTDWARLTPVRTILRQCFDLPEDGCGLGELERGAIRDAIHVICLDRVVVLRAIDTDSLRRLGVSGPAENAISIASRFAAPRLDVDGRWSGIEIHQSPAEDGSPCSTCARYYTWRGEDVIVDRTGTVDRPSDFVEIPTKVTAIDIDRRWCAYVDIDGRTQVVFDQGESASERCFVGHDGAATDLVLARYEDEPGPQQREIWILIDGQWRCYTYGSPIWLLREDRRWSGNAAG